MGNTLAGTDIAPSTRLNGIFHSCNTAPRINNHATHSLRGFAGAGHERLGASGDIVDKHRSATGKRFERDESEGLLMRKVEQQIGGSVGFGKLTAISELRQGNDAVRQPPTQPTVDTHHHNCIFVAEH